MGLKQIASRLIAKHGQQAVILRPGEETEDALGTPIQGPDTSHPATVLRAAQAVELQTLNSGQWAISDNRILISVDGLTIEPNTDDKLLLDGKELNASRVTRLAPAGEVLFYEMEVHDAT